MNTTHCLRFEHGLVLLEKLVRFRGFFPGDGCISNSADDVRLSLAYERIVFKQIQFLRVIDVCVLIQNSLRHLTKRASISPHKKHVDRIVCLLVGIDESEV